jgi:hypothetical protein
MTTQGIFHQHSINFTENYPWKIECFLEDLFLGGQSSIILGYRRLSVKSLLVCGQITLLSSKNIDGSPRTSYVEISSGEITDKDCGPTISLEAAKFGLTDSGHESSPGG